MRSGGDSSPVWGRQDSDSHIPLSHPVTPHPSHSQDHALLPAWRFRVEKALAGRRERVRVLAQSQGLGGSKGEGDDLGKLRGFGHKEGHEAAEHIPKGLEKSPIPTWDQ